MAKFTKEDIGKEVVLIRDRDGLLSGATGIIQSVGSYYVTLFKIKGKYHSEYCDECDGEDDECKCIEDWTDKHNDNYEWNVDFDECKLTTSYSTNDLILLLI